MMEEQLPQPPEKEPVASLSSEIGCVYRAIGIFLALVLLLSPFTFILEVTPRELRGRMFGPLATWRVQREIRDLVSENPTMTLLDLGDRNTNWLTDDIGELSELETLILNSNNLTELPAAIGNLRQLQELNLASNELERLPSEIGQLEQLTELNLNNNLLVELPAEIGQLTNLRVLNLNNNCELRTLPIELVRLPNLERLSLQRTHLTPFDIPQPLLDNPNLTIELGTTLFPCPPQDEENPVAQQESPHIAIN